MEKIKNYRVLIVALLFIVVFLATILYFFKFKDTILANRSSAQRDNFLYKNTELGFECLLPHDWSEWDSSIKPSKYPNISSVHLDNNVDPKWGKRFYILVARKSDNIWEIHSSNNTKFDHKQIIVDDLPATLTTVKHKKKNYILSKKVFLQKDGNFWRFIFSSSVPIEENDKTFESFLNSFHFI